MTTTAATAAKCYTVTDTATGEQLHAAANKPGALRWAAAHVPADRAVTVYTPAGNACWNRSATEVREAAQQQPALEVDAVPAEPAVVPVRNLRETRRAIRAAARAGKLTPDAAAVEKATGRPSPAAARTAAEQTVATRAYAGIPALASAAVESLTAALLAPAADPAPQDDVQAVAAEPVTEVVETPAAPPAAEQAAARTGRRLRVVVDETAHTLTTATQEYREGRRALWAGTWTLEDGRTVTLAEGAWRDATGAKVATMRDAVRSVLNA